MTRTIYQHQRAPSDSPWTLRQRLAMQLWWWTWALLCAWTPKPLDAWRVAVLRRFGARIGRGVQVHQRARIQIPWNLVMHDRSCLGDRANAYSLGEIEIGEGATVAQEAYLCTGTHAFEREALNLITEKIVIGPGAFVGARAFVLPGITVGAGAVVGACSVVSRDVGPGEIVAGNPARLIKRRGGGTVGDG